MESEIQQRIKAARVAADRLKEALDALQWAHTDVARDYGEPELCDDDAPEPWEFTRWPHPPGSPHSSECLATTGPCTCWLDAS